MQGMVDYKRRGEGGDFLPYGVMVGGFAQAAPFGGVLGVLAFPCFHGGLLALPLCGAALTFFAAVMSPVCTPPQRK
jgi:hypothetical protein